MTEVLQEPSLSAPIGQEVVDIAEHAQNVRRSEDLVNFRHTTFPRFDSVAMAGMALAGVLVTDTLGHGSVEALMAKGVVGGGALAANTLANRTTKSWRERHADRRQAEVDALCEEAGMTVELIRGRIGSDKKALDLRWSTTSAALGLQDALHSVQKLQDIAKQAGADRITLPLQHVHDFAPDGAKAQDQKDWLDILKKDVPAVDDAAQDEQLLVSFSQEELAALAERMHNALDRAPLDILIGMLSEKVPNHPAVKKYRLNGGDTVGLERTFRHAIEHRFDGTVAARSRDDGPIRRKLSVTGAVSVHRGEPIVKDKVLPSMQLDGSQQLLRAKQLTNDELVSRLDRWKQLPPAEVAELCELAAWQLIKGVDINFPEGFGLAAPHIRKPGQAHSTLEGARVPSLQSRFSKRIFGKTRAERNDSQIELGKVSRRVRKLIASCALTLSFVGGGIATLELDDQAKDSSGGVVEWLEDRRDTLGDSAQKVVEVLPGSLEDLTIEWHPGNSEDEKSDGLGIGETSASIGNVESEDDRPPGEEQYKLTAYGGADTSGYWAQNRYSVLRETDEGAAIKQTGQMYWDPALDKIADPVSQDRLQLPEDLDTSQPLIKVELETSIWALVDEGPAKEYCLDGADCVVGKLVAELPILDGSRLVAAQLEDSTKPFYAVNYPDNSQRILLPYDAVIGLKGDHKVRLAYWLQPNSADGLQAIEPTKVYDPVTEEDNDREYMPAVDAMWEQQIGEITHGPDRVEHMEDHMQDTFDYELNPLAKNSVVQSIEELTAASLEPDAANCNTADTMLTASNPDELNYIVGFYNRGNKKGSNPNALSMNEGHAWAADRQANIHDATPIHGTEDDQAYFEENGVNQAAENGRLVLDGLKLAALAAATATAYRFRKPAARWTRHFVAEKYMDSVNDGYLTDTVKTVNHAFYAPEDMPILRDARLLDRDDALETLRSLGRNGAYAGTQKALKSHDGSRMYRRDLRRARRLVWATRYARAPKRSRI